MSLLNLGINSSNLLGSISGTGGLSIGSPLIDLSPDNVVELASGARYVLDASANKKHFNFGSNRPVAILPGPNNDAPGLYCSGQDGQDASVPDAASLDITGNLSFFTDFQLDSYTDGDQYIIAKYDSTTTGSYALSVNSSGNLVFTVVDSSPANITFTSTATLGSVGVDAGDYVLIYAFLNVSTKTVQFQYSTSGLGGLTALGSSVVQAGFNGTIQASSENLQFGARSDGSPTDAAKGWIYSATIISGSLLGTQVCQAAFNTQATGTESFTDGTGNHTVTLNPLAATSADPRYLPYTDTKYAWFPGSNNYLSTPDSVALSITGDITLVMAIQPDDWTNDGWIFSKYLSTGNQISWGFRKIGAGKLRFYWSTDGTSGTLASATSTAIPSFTDGDLGYIAVTVDVDNGASDADIKFWTSADGVTWSQLGSTVNPGSTISIFDSTTAINVNGINGGGSAGTYKLYSAKIYDGLHDLNAGTGGTLVFDVDVDRDGATGSSATFTADTGQTMTVNRASSGYKTTIVTENTILFGTDDYLQHPDDSFFDFDGSQDFSLFGVVRYWGSSSTFNLLNRLSTVNDVGWVLGGLSGNGFVATAVSSTVSSAAKSGITAGVRTVVSGVRDAGTRLTAYVAGVGGTDTTTNTSQDTSNALAVRIGASSAGTVVYSDMEWTGAVIYDKALTAAQVQSVTSSLA